MGVAQDAKGLNREGGKLDGREPLVLVAAMQSEVRAVLAALRGVRRVRGHEVVAWEGRLGERDVVCLRCGMGWRRAEEALRRYGGRAGWVLSVGFAGGLKGRARAGDLVVASEFVWGEGGRGRYEVKPSLVRLLMRAARQVAVGCHVGRVYSTEKPLLSREDKQGAGERLDAVAVEMEARGLVAAAGSWGLPVAMVRVVVDPVNCTVGRLPFVAGGSAVERLRAAVDPKGWRRLFWLASQVRRGSPALTRMLAALGGEGGAS